MNADLTPSSLAISILTSQTFFDILLKVIIYFWGDLFTPKNKKISSFSYDEWLLYIFENLEFSEN